MLSWKFRTIPTFATIQNEIPMIKYFPFLFCALLLLSCEEQPETSLAIEETPLDLPARPNIVWIVAEDLSPVIPSFGDSTITTPNISRLAAEGVRYTNFYSPSGVCAPSRAAIALGMYPIHSGAQHMRTGPWFGFNIPQAVFDRMSKFWPEGVPLYEAMPPAEAHMHSHYLRQAGYYCTNNNKEDYQFRREMTAWDESSKEAHWKNRTPGQPFFSIFNINVTHESQIWQRANDSLWVEEDLEVPVPPYLPDTEVGRQDIRRMYSNIKVMDHRVGELLQELEEANLMDSTIIFWYTDHGGPLPRQKRLCYDSGLKVPMIIRFPGQQRANTIDDQLLSFIDLKPTILSLAGLAQPDYMDGQAWLGYAAQEPRQYIHGAGDRFDEMYDRIRAVRDHRFKYLRNYNLDQPYYLPVAYREQMPIMQELLRMRDAGELNEAQAQWFRETKVEEELFDTENDPHELNNLAANPEYAEKLAEMRAELNRWLGSIEDRGAIPEKEYIKRIWPGGQQPKTATPEFSFLKETIMLLDSTEGASIGYQWLAEGEEPTERWSIYEQPIYPVEGKTLVARAHRIGYLPSEELRLKDKERLE